MFKLKTWLATAAMVALVGTAQATLVNLGNGTVKDTATNLIWLQNWNVNGQQNWATQKAWADNLSFAGSDAWVLPSISQYTTVFAEVGNLTLVPQFTNVQFAQTNTGPAFYWSGTEDVPGIGAQRFVATSGFALGALETDLLFAVAVRPGDVVAAVPEPQSLALVLLALGAGAVVWRRRPL